jgi:RNA polymerase sigma factor (sigma-70 family)
VEKLERGSKTSGGSGFPATRWTLVNEAVSSGTSSEEALEKICQDYWYPLYAFARRSGSSASDAEDLTQGFFVQLLEKGWLSDADRAKGKLRTFLLTAFRRFQANEWRCGMAARRGGGKVMLMSDLEGVEERYADAQPGLTPEELFDRQWALAILAKVVEGLEKEFSDSGRQGDYEVLKSVLMADRGELNYAELAEALETSEGAARVAAHRLRKRFRQRFRHAIEETLDEGADLSEEMAFLAKVLAE